MVFVLLDSLGIAGAAFGSGAVNRHNTGKRCFYGFNTVFKTTFHNDVSVFEFKDFLCVCNLGKSELFSNLGLGLYGHNFVFWASSWQNRIFPTGVFCARYDVPAFFAALTILPMLVQFVVGLETRFAPRHRACFDAILYGGRLEDVRAAKGEMERVLYAELAHMLQLQLIVTIASVAFLGNFLQTVGLDETMTGTFRVLCFGYCLYGLVKCTVVVLLYFDDRAGACRAAALFAAISLGGSLLTLAAGPDAWGAGFLLAGAVTGFRVLGRLRR